MDNMEIISTEEVATREECDPRTARKWAADNGVQFVGQAYHKNYLWTEADIKRFREREKPGRRWPEKEEKTKKARKRSKGV